MCTVLSDELLEICYPEFRKGIAEVAQIALLADSLSARSEGYFACASAARGWMHPNFRHMEYTMDTGQDFLRAQVNNCIMQHQSLLSALREHAEHGEEPAFRALCARQIPALERHQSMIEEYGKTIDAQGGGAVKNAIGVVAEKARDLVEAFRESDFLRLVGDIVMIRQAQDTFATFAKAGEQLGDRRLAALGRACEKDHDGMQQEFNDYIATLFVAHVRAEPKGPQADEPMSRMIGSAAMITK